MPVWGTEAWAACSMFSRLDGTLQLPATGYVCGTSTACSAVDRERLAAEKRRQIGSGTAILGRSPHARESGSQAGTAPSSCETELFTSSRTSPRA